MNGLFSSFSTPYQGSLHLLILLIGALQNARFSLHPLPRGEFYFLYLCSLPRVNIQIIDNANKRIHGLSNAFSVV